MPPVRAVGAAVATTLIAVTALAPAGAADSRDRDRDLPTLRATGTVPGGSAAFATSFRLAGLERSEYKVLSRPSSRSIVVGYPASRPCARARISLALVAAGAGPVEHVRSRLPVADREGEERRATGPDFSGGSVTTRAWRINGDIRDSRKLVVQGVTATATEKGGRAVLQTVRIDARTLGYPSACATGNRFTVGPDLERLIADGED